MPNTVHTHAGVTAYLPRIVLDALSSAENGAPTAEQPAGWPDGPIIQHMDRCAVLFLDIVGFTPLCEALAVKGEAPGAELLATGLKSYWEVLQAVTRRWGGDVVKYAGDALKAIWQVQDDGSGLSESAAVRCAIQAALEIQSQLHDASFVRGTSFRVRIGIGLGPSTLYILGDQAAQRSSSNSFSGLSPGPLSSSSSGRLEFLLVGPATAQAVAAEKACGPGQVVASPSAWAAARQYFRGVALPSTGDEQYVRVLTCRDAMSPPAAAVGLGAPLWPAAAQAQARERPGLEQGRQQALSSQTDLAAYVFSGGNDETSGQLLALAKRCLPAALLPHLSPTLEPFANELRTVSVVFLHLAVDSNWLHGLDNVENNRSSSHVPGGSVGVPAVALGQTDGAASGQAKSTTTRRGSGGQHHGATMASQAASSSTTTRRAGPASAGLGIAATVPTTAQLQTAAVATHRPTATINQLQSPQAVSSGPSSIHQPGRLRHEDVDPDEQCGSGRAAGQAGQPRLATSVLSSSALQDTRVDVRADVLGTLLSTIRGVCDEYQGDLNKAVCDEKGLFCLLVWGLAPQGHEDDPERAALAAITVCNGVDAACVELEARYGPALFTNGPYCSAGVTSGTAFCGSIGGTERREYTVGGNMVNTCARLMIAARQQGEDEHMVGNDASATAGMTAPGPTAAMPGQRQARPRGPCVLIDSATRESASHNPELHFTAIQPLKLKGKAAAVPAFIPSLQPASMPGDPSADDGEAPAATRDGMGTGRGVTDGHHASGHRGPVLLHFETPQEELMRKEGVSVDVWSRVPGLSTLAAVALDDAGRAEGTRSSVWQQRIQHRPEGDVEGQLMGSLSCLASWRSSVDSATVMPCDGHHGPPGHCPAAHAFRQRTYAHLIAGEPDIRKSSTVARVLLWARDSLRATIAVPCVAVSRKGNIVSVRPAAGAATRTGDSGAPPSMSLVGSAGQTHVTPAHMISADTARSDGACVDDAGPAVHHREDEGQASPHTPSLDIDMGHVKPSGVSDILGHNTASTSSSNHGVSSKVHVEDDDVLPPPSATAVCDLRSPVRAARAAVRSAGVHAQPATVDTTAAAVVRPAGNGRSLPVAGQGPQARSASMLYDQPAGQATPPLRVLYSVGHGSASSSSNGCNDGALAGPVCPLWSAIVGQLLATVAAHNGRAAASHQASFQQGLALLQQSGLFPHEVAPYTRRQSTGSGTGPTRMGHRDHMEPVNAEAVHSAAAGILQLCRCSDTATLIVLDKAHSGTGLDWALTVAVLEALGLFDELQLPIRQQEDANPHTEIGAASASSSAEARTETTSSPPPPVQLLIVSRPFHERFFRDISTGGATGTGSMVTSTETGSLSAQSWGTMVQSPVTWYLRLLGMLSVRHLHMERGDEMDTARVLAWHAGVQVNPLPTVSVDYKSSVRRQPGHSCADGPPSATGDASPPGRPIVKPLHCLPPALVRTIHILSGGHPGYASRLLHALVQLELVRVRKLDVQLVVPFEVMNMLPELGTSSAPETAGSAGSPYTVVPTPVRVLTSHISPTDFLPLPYRVQRLVSARLDRLSAHALLFIKTAAVLCFGAGQTQLSFRVGHVAAIYPADLPAGGNAGGDDIAAGAAGADVTAAVLPVFRPEILELLEYGLVEVRGTSSVSTAMGDAAEDHDTSQPHGGADGPVLSFDCGLTRDVVYHQMLYTQRRRLHRASAYLLLSGATCVNTPIATHAEAERAASETSSPDLDTVRQDIRSLIRCGGSTGTGYDQHGRGQHHQDVSARLLELAKLATHAGQPSNGASACSHVSAADCHVHQDTHHHKLRQAYRHLALAGEREASEVLYQASVASVAVINDGQGQGGRRTGGRHRGMSSVVEMGPAVAVASGQSGGSDSVSMLVADLQHSSRSANVPAGAAGTSEGGDDAKANTSDSSSVSDTATVPRQSTGALGGKSQSFPVLGHGASASRLAGRTNTGAVQEEEYEDDDGPDGDNDEDSTCRVDTTDVPDSLSPGQATPPPRHDHRPLQAIVERRTESRDTMARDSSTASTRDSSRGGAQDDDDGGLDVEGQSQVQDGHGREDADEGHQDHHAGAGSHYHPLRLSNLPFTSFRLILRGAGAVASLASTIGTASARGVFTLGSASAQSVITIGSVSARGVITVASSVSSGVSGAFHASRRGVQQGMRLLSRPGQGPGQPHNDRDSHADDDSDMAGIDRTEARHDTVYASTTDVLSTTGLSVNRTVASAYTVVVTPQESVVGHIVGRDRASTGGGAHAQAVNNKRHRRLSLEDRDTTVQQSAFSVDRTGQATAHGSGHAPGQVAGRVIFHTRPDRALSHPMAGVSVTTDGSASRSRSASQVEATLAGSTGAGHEGMTGASATAMPAQATSAAAVNAGARPSRRGNTAARGRSSSCAPILGFLGCGLAGGFAMDPGAVSPNAAPVNRRPHGFELAGTCVDDTAGHPGAPTPSDVQHRQPKRFHSRRASASEAAAAIFAGGSYGLAPSREGRTRGKAGAGAADSTGPSPHASASALQHDAVTAATGVAGHTDDSSYGSPASLHGTPYSRYYGNGATPFTPGLMRLSTLPAAFSLAHGSTTAAHASITVSAASGSGLTRSPAAVTVTASGATGADFLSPHVVTGGPRSRYSTGNAAVVTTVKGTFPGSSGNIRHKRRSSLMMAIARRLSFVQGDEEEGGGVDARSCDTGTAGATAADTVSSGSRRTVSRKDSSVGWAAAFPSLRTVSKRLSLSAVGRRSSSQPPVVNGQGHGSRPSRGSTAGTEGTRRRASEGPAERLRGQPIVHTSGAAVRALGFSVSSRHLDRVLAQHTSKSLWATAGQQSESSDRLPITTTPGAAGTKLGPVSGRTVDGACEGGNEDEGGPDALPATARRAQAEAEPRLSITRPVAPAPFSAERMGGHAAQGNEDAEALGRLHAGSAAQRPVALLRAAPSDTTSVHGHSVSTTRRSSTGTTRPGRTTDIIRSTVVNSSRNASDMVLARDASTGAPPRMLLWLLDSSATSGCLAADPAIHEGAGAQVRPETSLTMLKQQRLVRSWSRFDIFAVRRAVGWPGKPVGSGTGPSSISSLQLSSTTRGPLAVVIDMILRDLGLPTALPQLSVDSTAATPSTVDEYRLAALAQVMTRAARAVEAQGYYTCNPYHNALHAADVAQAAYALLRHGRIVPGGGRSHAGGAGHEDDIVAETSHATSSASASPVLSIRQVLTAVLAAAIHDYQHPGVSGPFLIASGHHIAACGAYDHPGLERYHAAEAFALLEGPELKMRVPEAVGGDAVPVLNPEPGPASGLVPIRWRDANVFELLADSRDAHGPFGPHHGHSRSHSTSEPASDALTPVPASSPSEVKSQVLSVVLATALVNQQTWLDGFWRDLRQACGTEVRVSRHSRHGSRHTDDGQGHTPYHGHGHGSLSPSLVLQLAVKAADVGNPAKPLCRSRPWSLMIMEEFYCQGVTEARLGLPVSRFMDPGQTTVDMPACQAGFATYIALPVFKAVAAVWPATELTSMRFHGLSQRLWTDIERAAKSTAGRGRLVDAGPVQSASSTVPLPPSAAEAPAMGAVATTATSDKPTSRHSRAAGSTTTRSTRNDSRGAEADDDVAQGDMNGRCSLTGHDAASACAVTASCGQDEQQADEGRLPPQATFQPKKRLVLPSGSSSEQGQGCHGGPSTAGATVHP